jgi:prevent-host-death family protein
VPLPRELQTSQKVARIVAMNVSVTEAKNKLTQLLTAVERGERVTIRRHGRIVAELVQPSARRAPKFGTLNGVVHMSPEQFRDATRPMTEEESEAFLRGQY